MEKERRKMKTTKRGTEGTEEAKLEIRRGRRKEKEEEEE